MLGRGAAKRRARRENSTSSSAAAGSSSNLASLDLASSFSNPDEEADLDRAVYSAGSDLLPPPLADDSGFGEIAGDEIVGAGLGHLGAALASPLTPGGTARSGSLILLPGAPPAADAGGGGEPARNISSGKAVAGLLHGGRRMQGWITKQGGSLGGRKNWKRRWAKVRTLLLVMVVVVPAVVVVVVVVVVVLLLLLLALVLLAVCCWCCRC